MDDDQELEEMVEWLAQLRESPDDDFRINARPYFDDTQELVSLWHMEGREAVTDHIARNYKGKHRK
jgi:hypothetical protein